MVSVLFFPLISEQNSEGDPTWGVPKYFAEKISKHGLQSVSWFSLVVLLWTAHAVYVCVCVDSVAVHLPLPWQHG